MKKILWVVALAVIVLPAALAAEIINSETMITMEKSSSQIRTKILINADERIGNLTLILTSKPIDISVIIDGEERQCPLQAKFVRCGSLEAGEHAIDYSYKTSYPIAKVGENTLFQYTDSLPYHSKKHLLALKLPIGFIIPREKGKDETFYINPKADEVYSDGQRIILSWEREDTQEVGITVVTREVLGMSIGWIIFIVAVIALVVGMFIYTVRTRKAVVKVAKGRKTKKREKQVVIPDLMESEQKIVDLLKAKGPLWQKQVQLETGFSKAKVSRVIRNLEARGVVKKVPLGNTNKIHLKTK